MKPYIVMHMMTSIDGRIVTTHWPRHFDVGGLYEEVHQSLQGDAWMVGPVTMAEFGVKAESRSVVASQTLSRDSWKAPGTESRKFAIALDRKGSLRLQSASANGDAVLVVLPSNVSDDHLAELRQDGISYLFAGETDIDLHLAMQKLHDEFGIKRLLLEGGGGINGAFLTAGLIDEISLMLMPFADGARGMPTLFDREVGALASTLQLDAVTRLSHDVLHLVYRMS